MMKQLNEMLKLAGLPIREEDEKDATPQHMKNEKALFERCCGCLEDVMKMCEERLKGEVTDEHKKQYTELCDCAKECCATMKKHVESYK